MYHRSETEEKRGKEKPLEHIESGRSYMKYAIGKFMDKEKGKQSWEK